MSFAGRTVLITGASGNLGRAVAAAFAAKDANLVLIGGHLDSLERAFPPSNGRRLILAADLVDADATQRAVDAARERYGRIDVLCNIAGGFRMGEAVHETSDETLDFLIAVNARTMLHAVRAVVPTMLEQGGGKVVNVGAAGAQKGAANMAAYAAAKSIVLRFTESMSAELRERNINVNCVLPTTIDTPENREAMPKADPSRWIAPSDLAHVIVFLASDEARAIHGAAIPVSGLS